MKFRRKGSIDNAKIEKEASELALTLQAEDGTTLLTFPAEVTESLRRTLSRLISKKSLPARLALVASLRQEGVTYLSRALATTMANDLGASVCVVELNWWWPDETLLAPLETGLDDRRKGLADVLAEELKLEEAILHTSRPNLDILPAGRMPVANRPIMVRSTLLKEILYQLSEQYEYLILDVPSISATNDAIPLASLGDACCMVIHQGVTTIKKVRSALDEIDHLNILGVILNKVELATPAFLVNLIPQDAVSEYGVAAG